MRGVVSFIIQILPIISGRIPLLYEYLDGATLDSLPVVFPPAEELEGSTEEDDGSTDLSTVNSVECVRMTFPGILLSI